MTTTISLSDNFSLRRAFAYGRIFSPWIKWQLVLTPLISLAVVVMNIFLGSYSFGLPFTALLSFIPSFMIYFSALVFAYGSDQVMETILPVKWSEKALFVIVYTLVVIPVCVDVPQYIAMWAAEMIDPEIVETNIYLSTRQLSTGAVNQWWGIIQQLLPAAVCLASVVFYTHRRMLMPVVWTIVSLIGLSIIGGICGIIGVAKYGASNLEKLVEQKPAAPDAIVNALMEEMQPYVNIAMGLSAIALAVIVWLICRKIKTRQL